MSADLGESDSGRTCRESGDSEIRFGAVQFQISLVVRSESCVLISETNSRRRVSEGGGLLYGKTKKASVI